MEYVNLGPSGLKVSRLCLGCMSYGDTSKGWHGDWVLSENESRPFIREAVEAGINFFDTANMYSKGASEEVIGRLLPSSLIATRLSLRRKPIYRGAIRRMPAAFLEKACFRPSTIA